MRIRIKKPNLKRLKSLSALGAGVLGIGGGHAEASTIIYSGVLDEKVGFSSGYGLRATLAGPNGAGAVFGRGAAATSFSAFATLNVVGKAGPHGTQFRFLASGLGDLSIAEGFPQGSRWRKGCKTGRACGTLDQGKVAWRISNATGTGTFSSFNATDRYLLFQFTGGDLAHMEYGWAQLIVTFTDTVPNETLVDWAYDTSGAKIPAGDTGTPEPSTLTLTGLAALALGAKGLRAWRGGRRMRTGVLIDKSRKFRCLK